MPDAMLAESGDKKLFMLPEKLRAVGEAGKVDFNPGDFKFILASFASIWLCIEPGRRVRKRINRGRGTHLRQRDSRELSLDQLGPFAVAR